MNFLKNFCKKFIFSPLFSGNINLTANKTKMISLVVSLQTVTAAPQIFACPLVWTKIIRGQFKFGCFLN